MVKVKTGDEVTPTPEPTLPAAPASVPFNQEVEFTTPSGKRIKMAKPGIPVKMLLPSLMSAAEPNVMSAFETEKLIRQVLYVREIDGKPTPTIENFGQVQQVCLQLGDEGLEAVEVMHSRYFPGLTEAQLKVIKK